ncbi:hypothetical protein ASPZODRAFT_137574 [Penicilliopsis zonata CBS 506.65]|uniref:non-specific serine/threonine protein kinase n=1 Tax=Penicilliopsis zonata CBS 506.65 TaxID=1073090 RepID=A0A1L9S4E7_9EURO|nr:hypothetical protein ASPZODRAFT_137574 [Penicilliopsis zonata CBS 506.65]OJJ42004.1 hypothetical protein ASPZODRAFT_137574 [Penicilliopsis zonata CBS 506.65]
MAKRRLFNRPTISIFPNPRLSFHLNIASSRIGLSKRAMADLRSPSEPRVFPCSGWDIIDPSLKIEEESIPSYKSENFYPVRIGEVFNHRYQVLGKLGYGSSATVWLCRDLLDHRYIALKIYTASKTVTREIEIYNHLRTVKSSHAGQSCLRPLLEVFQAQNPDGHSIHTCLVHPPLGISLGQLTPLLPDGVMSSVMVRTTIRNILAALDFLHTEAMVIHTDLQPNNILLGIKDDSILSQFEQAEFEAPAPRKILDDRTIYISRPLCISYGTPVLCDLGEARLGTDQQQGDIMPDIYRAPEVILDMSWDSKVDIWNVGMVIWDLFESRHLFRARNPARELDDGYHLAEMQAVLGSPPVEFLARSERSLFFWDENGNWKGAVPIPDYDLHTLEERLEGDEKDDFLRFLRRMLCWLPEERASAKDLLFDPWLMHGLFK